MDQPERCDHPIKGGGTGMFQERLCSLVRGHSGPHRSWVEEADEESEFEQYGDRERAREQGEMFGW